ncbi:MAG: LysM peptidoglycan-binding domain-containing protein [Gammaproteobacteria bacterium]|nr:LysM peptidoglycan-binding domain-containing protein [Gammaproteobacteria bacterium]
MNENGTGGSTQHERNEPPAAPGASAGPALAVLAAAALLAGCQSFALRSAGTTAPEPQLISPLAGSILGDPPLAELLEASAVEPLRVPSFEFEPLPDPPITDVVERLRAGFVLPATEDAAYQRELEWYAKHPDYLERVFTRASRYLHHIAESLEARGMPADLALLPIVESAFDPFAYSHGRAAGLWQIIPGTARRLGIKQDWWFDGRRDVLESTRGALDYLELLHEQFDGDWLLAVAGYNSGPGNVARALKRAAAAGRGSDFWSIRPYLPRETRTYVPRLLAMRELVARPDAYGIDLPAIANEPYFAVVETGGQIDMTLAAQLAGLETDQLYELNAGVNRWATHPEGPHRMLVPIAHAERFAKALAELGERQRVEWTRYRIQSGDTLIELARQFNTTPEVLREVNGLGGNIIRAGAHLMIPHAVAARASYTLSADSRSAQIQNRERAGERRVHVVRRGESLWSISRRYGVNVRALASWNGMAPGDTLGVGRELVVWTSATAADAGQAGPVSVSFAASVAQEQIRRVNYVVRAGDSLSSIARRFRVTVPKLLEWNDGVSTRRYLQPGQRLVMFVDVAEQST